MEFTSENPDEDVTTRVCVVTAFISQPIVFNHGNYWVSFPIAPYLRMFAGAYVTH